MAFSLVLFTAVFDVVRLAAKLDRLRMSWRCISSTAADPDSRLRTAASPINAGDAHAGHWLAQLPMLSQSWHKYAHERGICCNAACVMNSPRWSHSLQPSVSQPELARCNSGHPVAQLLTLPLSRWMRAIFAELFTGAQHARDLHLYSGNANQAANTAASFTKRLASA
jgi:hypothetical protein